MSFCGMRQHFKTTKSYIVGRRRGLPGCILTLNFGGSGNCSPTEKADSPPKYVHSPWLISLYTAVCNVPAKKTMKKHATARQKMHIAVISQNPGTVSRRSHGIGVFYVNPNGTTTPQGGSRHSPCNKCFSAWNRDDLQLFCV